MKETKKEERERKVNVCVCDIRKGTYQTVPMKIMESVEVDDDGNDIPELPIECVHQFAIKLEKGYFCITCQRYVMGPSGTAIDEE